MATDDFNETDTKGMSVQLSYSAIISNEYV